MVALVLPADAPAVAAAVRKRLDDDEGLPRKGEHVGAGPHVPMSDDPASPGWTREAARLVTHPTDGRLAIVLEPRWLARVAELVTAAQLAVAPTPAQRVLRGLAAPAVLTPDWFPAPAPAPLNAPAPAVPAVPAAAAATKGKTAS